MTTNLLDSSKQVKHNVFQGETINSISMGYGHSAALTSSGRLFLWGSNLHGQLGDDYPYISLIPIDITARFHLTDGESITYVSLGTFHSSALTSSGRLFMWGENYNGELGDGTTNDSSKPVEITTHFTFLKDERIIQTSLGSSHSSAVTSLGRLFLWGDNGDGELGDGTIEPRNLPFDITPKLKLDKNEIIKLVRISQARSTALTSSNRLFIWGDSRYGSKPTDITSKLQLNPQEIIKDINVELNDLYVLTSQGRLLDVNYQFGEVRSIKDLSEKFDLSDGETITQISIKRFHHAVLTSLGRLFMWGDNESGQLGDKTRTSRENPVEIASNFNLFEGESLKTISLGNEHSSALTSLGRLFMWGENYNGELGDGGEKNRLTPVDITSGKATL